MTQTYLPYTDFTKIAECLDNKRLCKQITEAKQVYTANCYEFGKQGNPHPYTMWKGYEACLALYIVALYKEWQIRLVAGRRGGKIYHKAGEYILAEVESDKLDLSNIEYPKWFINEKIFSSYRAALLAKDFEHYSQFGWDEIPVIDYVYGINS